MYFEAVASRSADIAAAFARDCGVGRSYAETVQALESPTGAPNAAGSGATGPYQIMPATRAAYPAGTSDDAILEDLTQKNRSSLQVAIGREPTDSEVFMAHRLGAGGAAAILNAPAGADVRATLAPIFATAFATQNPWTTFLIGLSASVGAGISKAVQLQKMAVAIVNAAGTLLSLASPKRMPRRSPGSGIKS